MTKVFITKFALTRGIEEAEADETAYGDMVTTRHLGYTQYFHGNEFHLTMEEAVKDAEHRRLKKIQSLEKQIEKFKNLKF